MKLFIHSFGCQMSVADGVEMSRPLVEKGFSLTPHLEDADAILLNTCTVRQHAEDRAISMIGRLRLWKEERPERFLIVAGCAAERLSTWIQRRFPHVDLVVGAKSIEHYPELLDQALRKRFDWARENEGVWDQTQPAVQQPPSSVSAFLTIMRGCNYSCTYCIVPAVRGRELYRPWEKILDEARAHAASGIQELVLLGQTVNSYQDHEDRDFADLLNEVGRIQGLRRVRFMSPHPFFLNERMARAMAECATVCPHLHLPVQSGSDRILKLMRRNYTREDYLQKIRALKRRIPELELSTDFIVGFPGETEEDFQSSLSLAQEADFCSAYCFKYSAREGTKAANMPGQIPEFVKEERLARLLEAVTKQSKAHLKRLRGRRVSVLLETPSEGRTEHNFKARLSQSGTPGQIIEARVTDITASTLLCT